MANMACAKRNTQKDQINVLVFILIHRLPTMLHVFHYSHQYDNTIIHNHTNTHTCFDFRFP